MCQYVIDSKEIVMNINHGSYTYKVATLPDLGKDYPKTDLQLMRAVVQAKTASELEKPLRLWK